MQESATLPPPVFVDLNVLPEELRPRRYPAWYVLGVIAVLAASVLLIPLYRAEKALDAETARLRAELTVMNEDLGSTQIDFGRARELRQQLDTVEAAVAALDEERQALLGEGQRLSSDLSAIMQALPPGAHLSSIGGGEGQLTLVGRASGAADVLQYSATLAGDRFAEARITSLTAESPEEAGAGVAFTLEVEH